MKHLLVTDNFCNWVWQFIVANISGDIAHLDGSSILSLPKDKATAFSHPVDPWLPDYENLAHDAEIATA